MTTDQLEQFEGNFYSSEISTTCSIILKDGNLVAEHKRMKDAVLKPLSRDNFRGNWSLYNIKFVRKK